jgi:beta-lactamase regulating signal transducer with metallopeptidase domain
MAAVVNALLEVTVYSAVLYGAILLFQKLFKKHISAVMNYAVWALLILRLVVPVTVDTGIRFFVLPQENAVQAETVNEADPARSEDIRLQPAGVTPSRPITGYTAASPDTGLAPRDAAGTAGPASAPARSIGWRDALVILWAAGVIGFLAWKAVLMARLRRSIGRNEIPVPESVMELTDACKRELGIRGDIAVSVQIGLNSPALHASLRPRLLLPEHMLGTADSAGLGFGIRHELTHYRRRDHLVCLLLVFLRCVYWFNPVVWLAARRIETDMEAACDAGVARGLTAPARKRYIRAMIDLSGTPCGQYMLGMGMGRERKAMEKRIRGLYLPKKAGLSAKMSAAVLACILTVACFTTACQPTPEKAVVVNKADGALETKLTQAPASAPAGKSLRETLGVPERWVDSFDFSNGKIKFSVDTPIEVPDAQKVPVAEVSPAAFTQEQVDKMVSVLFKESPLYAPQGLTRADWQKQIVQIQSDMEKVKNDKYDEKAKNEMIKVLKDNLSDAEKQYAKAPESIPKIPASSKIGMVDDPHSKDKFNGVNAMADTPAGSMVFLVRTGKDRNSASMYPKASDGTGSVRYEHSVDPEMKQPEGVAMSRGDAEKIAADIAKQLDGGLTLAHTEIVQALQQYGDDYAWQMTFNRSVNGFPTTYEGHEAGMDMYVDIYEPVLFYEKIVITVDDKGVVGFEWITPMRVDKIVNENATLLPFKDIEKAARDMLKKNPDQITRRYSGDPMPDIAFPIGRVTFGLTRVGQKDKPGAYRLLPVWDFYQQDKDATLKNTYSILTLNAVDGSVIDRNLGY